MVLTFDIDMLLISIFDNIVSNQEIRHFVPLWPYISKVLHFWSSMTVDLFEGGYHKEQFETCFVKSG